MDKAFAAEYAALEERHWWFRARRRILGDLLSRLPWPSQPFILEIGTGPGFNLRTLYPKDARLRGVEPEPDNARLAGANSGVRVDVATAENLPPDLLPSSLDAITYFDVLEHLDDPVSALIQAVRLLKPGGWVVATVPAYQWMWGRQDEASFHRRRYARGLLLAQLAAAGLEPERCTYFNALLFLPVALFRLAARLRRAPREAGASDFGYPPGPINAALERVFGFEAVLLRRLNFPFGVSIFAVARKPGA